MELWKSTHLWLTTCGHRVNKDFCREEIAGHPDYPALTALIDFLDMGSMSYNAVQADPSYINEFSYPLLAHVAVPGDTQMRLIESADGWQHQNDTLSFWSGVIIQPVAGSTWVNAQNLSYITRKQRNIAFITAWFVIGLTLYVKSVFDYPDILMNAFGLLSLSGLLISLTLVSMELGFTSQIVKQICGTISPRGCERVIKNKYAAGYAGITLADASLAYFATQLSIYLLGCIYHPLLTALLPLAYGGIFIAAGSIYIQARKIKAWCALCLAIVSILVLQNIAAIILFAHLSISVDLWAWPVGIAAALIIELPIKELIKSNLSQRGELAKFRRWKQDPNLFLQQWRDQQTIDQSIWPNDLLLGSKEAKLQITVACNPYCGPCAKAHVQLDRLLEKFGNKLSVQMRFLSFGVEEKDNAYAKAVSAILRRATTIDNERDLRAMLTDWFEIMDYDLWNTKWEAPSEVFIKERLSMHQDWISQSNIESTPTFFINGKKLPDRYSLDDFEYLMPELSNSEQLQRG